MTRLRSMFGGIARAGLLRLLGERTTRPGPERLPVRTRIGRAIGPAPPRVAPGRRHPACEGVYGRA